MLLTFLPWRKLLWVIALLGLATAGVIATLLPATGQGEASEAATDHSVGKGKGGLPLLLARSARFRYIEVFYNRTRLHGALGFYSPVDFEQNLNQNNQDPALRLVLKTRARSPVSFGFMGDSLALAGRPWQLLVRPLSPSRSP